MGARDSTELDAGYSCLSWTGDGEAGLPAVGDLAGGSVRYTHRVEIVWEPLIAVAIIVVVWLIRNRRLL